MSGSVVKFDKPPVTEVVFGVTFSLAQPMRTVDFGAYWQSVQADFPEVREQPPVQQSIEPRDGVDSILISYEVQPLPPLRRMWFISADGRTLLQLQEDRLMLNWRKLPGDRDAVYPGNDVLMPMFWKYWDGFERFLAMSPLGPPTVLQVEHSYINAITGISNISRDLGDILVDHQRDNELKRFLPKADRFNWVTSYSLPDNAGRLHVTAQSAKLAETSELIVRLELMARGLPSATDRSSLVAWFDVAHH